MKASKKIDMTQGSIMRQVLIFALPICAGNVLQQLYGTVDTLVIGNFCGSVSLAAVGTSSQPVEMLLCIFLGLGTGVSILVSQFSGSGDGKSQREIVATAISFLYICAIPLAVIGPVCRAACAENHAGAARYLGPCQFVYPNYFYRNSGKHGL